ncbi:putative DNA-binding domain-containing protein [Burkholderia sp. 22PA0099]|uniref:HvfC/BufC family peptide modification chaperone n=1 Tax=Burkholderia sp. 22PA0099 TaxID=3237372 RepID=UPI0039C350EC
MDDAMSMAAIQRWMQMATTHPGGLDAGLAQAAQHEGADIVAVIAVPGGVDPLARLAVYADGYWLRLIGCLEAEYPALLRLLGPTLFRFFARAYLHRHPSRSPTLHALGAAFPAFLLGSQRRAGGGVARPVSQSFPLDLARLERAIAESGRAAGIDNPVRGAGAATMDVLPLLTGASCTVALPATTRLLTLRHAADGIRPWLRGQRPDEPPARQANHVAIRRHRFRVSMEPLADWQFFALRRVARRPGTLAECARAAARRTGLSESELHARLALWLPTAQAASLVMLT